MGNKRGTAGGFKCYVSFWYSNWGSEGNNNDYSDYGETTPYYNNDYSDYGETTPYYNNDYMGSQWNDTANDWNSNYTTPYYNNDYDWSQWNDTANDWNSNYTGPTGGYYDGPNNGGYYNGNDWSQWNDTANDWNSNYTTGGTIMG